MISLHDSGDGTWAESRPKPATDGAKPGQAASETRTLFNAVTKSNAARRAGQGILRRPHPLTGEPSYTRDEEDFLYAIDSYKRQTGRMFPTWSEVLAVARGIGYDRVPHGFKIVRDDALDGAVVGAA